MPFCSRVFAVWLSVSAGSRSLCQGINGSQVFRQCVSTVVGCRLSVSGLEGGGSQDIRQCVRIAQHILTISSVITLWLLYYK